MLHVPGRRSGRPALLLLLALATAGCAPEPEPVRPNDVPALHHTGLNTVDAQRAVDWYVSVWPEATATEMNGQPAVAAEMYLVFNETEEAPPGAFHPQLGRPEEQSAFWHIGAFANTTDMDVELGAIGVRHAPLFRGPDDEAGTWRSGLTPYQGILLEEDLADAPIAEPRPGGFSYVTGPDGALFEFTGGPNTNRSLSHVHLFHEQPQCAANWYVEMLGMSLPPIRNDDGSTSPRPAYEPCEADFGPAGWPSLERVGTIRQPRGTILHGNGSIGFYPRQCVRGRCGEDRPLVPSRGQVLDHVAFSVEDLDAWRRWLGDRVTIIEEIHDFDEGRAFMFEGPDRLAIEFVSIPGA